MKRRTVLGALAATGIVQAVGAGKASAAVTTVPDDTWTNTWQNKNDWDWSGGDQCTTFKNNGFTYWIFGDTIQSNGETTSGGYPAGWRMVPNTIMLQQGTSFVKAMADGSDGIPRPLTTTGDNDERYWPQGAFFANSHIYILCQRVDRNPDDGKFRLIGGEIAKFRQQADGTLVFVGMCMTPATGKLGVAGPQGIQWCSEGRVANGVAYIYGATLAEGNPYVLHYSYVARVPVAELENPMAWRFYKKSTGTWVDRISALDQDKANQTDSIVASQLSSVRWINGRYVMLHKPWNNWGSAVKAAYSSTAYGPWTGEHTIFESPAGTFEGLEYETYGPILHPEVPLDSSGRTLVSIKWNFKEGSTLATIASNADLYKPRFYRVQF